MSIRFQSQGWSMINEQIMRGVVLWEELFESCTKKKLLTREARELLIHEDKTYNNNRYTYDSNPRGFPLRPKRNALTTRPSKGYVSVGGIDRCLSEALGEALGEHTLPGIPELETNTI